MKTDGSKGAEPTSGCSGGGSECGRSAAPHGSRSRSCSRSGLEDNVPQQPAVAVLSSSSSCSSPRAQPVSRSFGVAEVGKKLSSGKASKKADKQKKVKKKDKKKKKKKQRKKEKKREKKLLKKQLGKKNKGAKKRKKKVEVSVSSSSSSSSSAPVNVAADFEVAAERGNIFVAHRLLRKNGMEWVTGTGDGPLHIAVKKNRAELVEWILKQNGFEQIIDARNAGGETPLFVAARFCRATVALHLLHALADPGICNVDGETPEALDLNGLIEEAEQGLAVERSAQRERLLAAVQVAKRRREEKEWRERLFDEEFEHDHETFGGYEDLEQMDLKGGPGDWMDDIAAQVELRKQGEVRATREERLRSAMQVQEVARAQADAQEQKAREAAQADARRRPKAKAAAGSADAGASRGAPAADVPADSGEARIAARAADDARWRAFEDHVKERAAAAGDVSQEQQLQAKSVPWPSGPPGNPLHIDPGGHPSVVKSQLRSGLLRWHPDKFAQRFGGMLPGDGAGREGILQRVKDIAQQLNRLMAELTSESAASASQPS